MFVVTIKHGKTEYKNVELAENWELFQAAVMSLTNVPIDRQKFIIKGKTIKDEATYKTLKNVRVVYM